MNHKSDLPNNPPDEQSVAMQTTDREIYRTPSNITMLQDTIHVTKEGNIGINVAGFVIVMSLRDWHAMAKETLHRTKSDE